MGQSYRDRISGFSGFTRYPENPENLLHPV
jgi:hypothetical protein